MLNDGQARDAATTQELAFHAALDTIEKYRLALIRCAELAGADGEAVEAARSGALTYPPVEDFAINMVAQLREDYNRAD